MIYVHFVGREALLEDCKPKYSHSPVYIHMQAASCVF